MSNLNWAQPVFGNDIGTSQAYLERLQEFLAQQSGMTASPKLNTGTSASGISPTAAGNSTGSPENHKRKNPSDDTDANTSSALKDRRQSAGNSTNVTMHSHTHDRSESPPDESTTKGKKGSTSDKRKEQNRNAQRAFRERKERVLKDLEDKIEGLNKVNSEQLSENQNLRQLVERLQEENARLQKSNESQPPAPSSSFTFTMPNTSTSSSSSPLTANSQPQNLDMPSSFSDADISAFLSRPVPQSQQASPSQFPSLIQSNMSGSRANNDDWFWNSSAFGTEIPQAAPASVMNLTDTSSNSSINALFPWAFETNSSSGNVTSNNNGQNSSNNSYPQTNDAFSSFLNFSNNQQSAPQRQQQSTDNRQNSTNSNSGSSRAASTTNSSSRRVGSNGNFADSPETTCSSSGSDPSENQPGTPSSAQPFPFGTTQGKEGSFTSLGGSQGFSQGSFGLVGSGQGQSNNTAFSSYLNGGGSILGGMTATTPSGVFDTMSYRDPLFAGLDDSAMDPLGSFAPYLNQAKSENLDFNDFLVTTPPSFGAGESPVRYNSYDNKQDVHSASSSSASVPTLGSISNAPSTSSGQSYSTNSTSPRDPASAFSLSGTGEEALPYAIHYSHPLIQHIGQDMHTLAKEAGFSKADAEIADAKLRKGACGSMPEGSGGADEIDSLCRDMYLKAQCKEFARQRIQSSINQDETTLKLYEQYLRENQPKAA